MQRPWDEFRDVCVIFYKYQFPLPLRAKRTSLDEQRT